MAMITIVKGDFDGTWILDKETMTKGIFKKQEIPITEVIRLTKEETIGKDLYIAFELGTTQTFTAIMKEKDYKKVYDKFLKVGNNPKHCELPIKRNAVGNVIWSGVGMLILIAMLSGGNNKPSSSSSSSNDWSDIDPLVYCKIALEDAATYGARFPFGMRKTVYPYPNNQNKFSVIMGAEIKNAYGTWGKSTVSCVVNGQSVDKLVVDGSVIWGN